MSKKQKIKPRTITGEVNVWLTEYSGIGPRELVTESDETLMRGLSFSNLNMAPSWTRIGTASVTVHLESADAIVTGKVESLRAEQKKVVAEAQRKSTDLERQIQQLLAITYEPEEA